MKYTVASSRMLWDKVPEATQAKLQKLAKKFSEDIMRMVKTRQRAKKLEDEIQALSGGVYPAGVRPYKVQFNDPNLNRVFNVTVQKFSIEIKAGSTVNEAKAKIYMETQKFFKELDHFAMDKSIEDMYESTDFAMFEKACQKAFQDEQKTISKLVLKSWPKGLEQACTGLAEGKAAVLFDKLARKVAEQFFKKR